ncbi:elongation factor G [Polycladidibacter hongkongensis]|uniref:elongation factor G n=1 Tax=Polycladidibacter hongkongensis TaxID=1647556 RepID=UPI00082BF008|nr:elongation factor G [Pseudovibrio hongkongensis]
MGEKRVGDAGGRGVGPRCVAIVGPFGSGKTTLLEALLARTGAISRQGSVSAGTTLGDASPEARSHTMSVELNVAGTNYKGEEFIFIDTPGSIEFLQETDAVLDGVDMAIVVAEPDEKKIPALQVILKHLEDRGIPRIMYLNKIDRASHGVRHSLMQLQRASAVPLVLRQLPMWKDGHVTGFIDLALERAFIYHDGAPSEQIAIPSDDQAREVEARYNMLETLADHDDALMEQLLEDIAPETFQVFEDLVGEMKNGDICPVFIGSSEQGNGIRRLLKALRHEGPRVVDTCSRLGIAPEGVPLLQVLKTLHTAHGGKLSIARVLRGSVAESGVIYAKSGEVGKPAGLFTLQGEKTTKVASCEAGGLVGLAKLEPVSTGETLGVGAAPEVLLDSGLVLEPTLSKAIAVEERKDEVRLSAALAKLVEEDPSLRMTHVQSSAETLLEGQGEMHLRVALEKLQGRYGLAVKSGMPSVAYMETIRSGTNVRGRHKKQSGGHGQFGDVVIDIAPMPRGEGHSFSDTISGGVVPKQYIPSVGEGVKEALQKGPLGFPVVDVAVVLRDGSYHSVDSSDQAFRMAAILGMREGLPQCKPVLLEPICKVVVHCPSETTAKINAIISGRRGQILGFDARENWDGWDEVEAMVPESELADIIVEMRSATAGVASLKRSFDHLAELTGRAAEQVVKAKAEASA